MFNEIEQIPSEYKNFQAPKEQKREKKPGFWKRLIKSKTTRALTLGATAVVASPESANADWKEGVRTGNETMRTISDSATQIKDANTRRKQVEEQSRIERERIAAEERMRLAEIKARKETDMAREKTQRQERAGDVAIQTGKDEFSTETTDDKTTFKSGKQGTTPQERIEAGRNLSEENRLEIERKMQKDKLAAEKLIRQQTDPMYKNIKVPREKIK